MTSDALEKPVVSVIIVNYRTPGLTRQAVESVYKCASSFGFEVIVVDNASNDGSAEELAQIPGITLVLSEQNLGFAGGSNLAREYASGKYLFLLNSDAYFTDDCLERLVAYMEVHPAVGAVAPRCVMPDGRAQNNLGSLYSARSVFLKAFEIRRLRPVAEWLPPWVLRRLDSTYFDDKTATDEVSAVEMVTGAAMLLRSELVDKIGGLFDEELSMYVEDVDLCKRIRKAGRQIHYVRTMEIVHLVQGSAGSEERYGSERHFRSILYYFNKHREYFQAFLSRCVLGIRGVVGLSVFPLLLFFRSVARSRKALMRNLGLVRLCYGSADVETIVRGKVRSIKTNGVRYPVRA